MRKIFTAIFLSIIATLAMAKEVTISGQDSSYAGQTITAYYEYDGITHRPVVLDTATVGADGRFTMRFDLIETQKCYFDLAWYKGVLFIEPGMKYSVNFPPYKPLTIADQLNPYFMQYELMLSLNNARKDDLNVLIDQFETEMDKAWESLLFGKITPNNIDAARDTVESRFAHIYNKFFFEYRSCSYAQLVNLYAPLAPYFAIDVYYIHNSVKYSNPAFWEGFNSLFESFRQLEVLKDNRALYEIAIMQKVNNKVMPVSMLDSVRLEHNLPIAKTIRYNLTKAQPGTNLGVDGFTNLLNEKKLWSDFETPLIYIIVNHSALKECASDLETARKMAVKWKRKYSFVTIFAKENSTAALKACRAYPDKENVGSCTGNSDIIDALNIHSVPCYFVIDRNGRIIESPALEMSKFDYTK